MTRIWNASIQNRQQIQVQNRDTVDVWLAVGLSLQECLYVDPELRRVIRMYSFSKVNELFPGAELIPITNAKDGHAVGAFKSADLTLTAVDPYPIYGAEHTTTMTVSALVRVHEIAEYFRNQEISIGPDNIKSKVKPG